MNRTRKSNLLLCIFIFVTSFAVNSCGGSGVGDTDSPAAITDLILNIARQLGWTATGDDGNSGRARIYDLRFFSEDEVAAILGVPSLAGVPFPTIQQAVQGNFENATQILNEPAPDGAGTPQNLLTPRLDTTGTESFFFALAALDEVGNSSGPSNVVEVQTLLVAAEFTNSAGVSCFGEAVGGGNFNGDQFGDIAIGDPCAGRVYIFFGRGDLITGSADGDGLFDVGSGDTADVTIIGSAADSFGASVVGVGNVGGNGNADLAIGAPDFNGGTGRVFIVFGSLGLPQVIDFTAADQPDGMITGESAGDNFGTSIAGVAGVEGGIAVTMLVGAPGADSGAGTGKVYLFRSGNIGQNTSAAQAQAIFVGQNPGDMFGFSLAGAGDLDGDFFSEFAVGAPGVGDVHVFFGESGISAATADEVVIIGVAANGFGMSVAGGGDVNEDGSGIPDLLVGAPGTSSNRGSVFLYSGASIGAARASGVGPAASTEFTGESSGDMFGTSISIPGDVNPTVGSVQRDAGFIILLTPANADFVAGAPGNSGGAGRVYLFLGRNNFGSPVPASMADVVLNGGSPGDQFGRVVTGLGDISGDLIIDFAAAGLGFVRAEF